MYRPKSGLNRYGISLLELLAAVTIIAVIAAAVIPRLGTGGSVAKSEACCVNQEVIQIQSMMWRRERGNWPAADLGDIGNDTDFFPEGLPTCPVDGSAYNIDSATGKVVAHLHD